jgi:hypothetical protein
MIRTALVSLSLALLPLCSGLSATARHAPALRLQPRPRFAVPLRCAAAEGEAFDAPVPPSSTLPPAQQQSGGDRRVAVSGLSPQSQAGQQQQEQYVGVPPPGTQPTAPPPSRDLKTPFMGVTFLATAAVATWQSKRMLKSRQSAMLDEFAATMVFHMGDEREMAAAIKEYRKQVCVARTRHSSCIPLL